MTLTQKEQDAIQEIYQQSVDGLITAEECLDHPGFNIPALLELVKERAKMIREAEDEFKRIRVTLDSKDKDCLGDARDYSGHVWPIRDEMIHRITRVLSRLNGEGE